MQPTPKAIDRAGRGCIGDGPPNPPLMTPMPNSEDSFGSSLTDEFRKKPVVINAVQWDGTYTGMLSVMEHFPEMTRADARFHSANNTVDYWRIRTLEGAMQVSPGDWIIKGIAGEYYPCKPEIFEASYERTSPVPAPAPTGWRPIAEAPKDGTEIILSNGKDVSAGSWFGGDEGTCDRDGAPNGDERDAGWMDWSGGMLPEPTHFMPIPAAPGATSQGVAVAQPDAPPAIKNKGVAFRDWETHPLYKSATAMGHFDAGWMRCLAATTSKD